MQVKTIGWIVGSLGLLVGAGTAWGADTTTTTTTTETTAGTTSVSPSAGGRECRDAGVTVAFKTGSAELDTNARGALDGVATWMKADDSRTLHLEGFADTTGDSAANLVLSAKRAEAVKNYLMEKGVDQTKVLTVGRGEEIDHLPANGRAVTFLACRAAPTVAEAEPTPPPAPPAAPEPEPEPTSVVAPPPVVQPVVVLPPATPRPRWASGFGWALMAGGGYQDFTKDNMRDVTQGGGYWDARFIGGTNSIIGFEAAYLGSARSINMLGATANNPTLVSNGFEGTVRINAPLRRGAHLVEPYGYAGLGYQYFNIQNYNSNTAVQSSFSPNDNVMTVPVGGGLAYAYKSFIMDARAGWTATYYQELLNTGATDNTLNAWSVGSKLGFMF
jgi:outer membrane protein OmpA-like peptidoglycan-associated protein